MTAFRSTTTLASRTIMVAAWCQTATGAGRSPLATTTLGDPRRPGQPVATAASCIGSTLQRQIGAASRLMAKTARKRSTSPGAESEANVVESTWSHMCVAARLSLRGGQREPRLCSSFTGESRETVTNGADVSFACVLLQFLLRAISDVQCKASPCCCVDFVLARSWLQDSKFPWERTGANGPHGRIRTGPGPIRTGRPLATGHRPPQTGGPEPEPVKTGPRPPRTGPLCPLLLVAAHLGPLRKTGPPHGLTPHGLSHMTPSGAGDELAVTARSQPGRGPQPYPVCLLQIVTDADILGRNLTCSTCC